MSKEISKWSDEFMFSAERSSAKEGPKAFLIAGTPDPLGSIAVAAEAYMGNFYEDKSQITDEQRRYYLAEMQKTKLKMPMEAVQLHFRIKNVTRSFTHQMVRQRTAAYSQESMRFAVKEDAQDAVALPPSLAVFNQVLPDGQTYGDKVWEQWGTSGAHRSPDQKVRWYIAWRKQVEDVGDTYTYLVNDGMPAEDARGLLVHNTVTQLNYITNLRSLQDHSGNRLCTQAQFEWRLVWVAKLQAMRDFCTKPSHSGPGEGSSWNHGMRCDNWQWREIANLFMPVCYQLGSCQFQAEFDRKCSIRGRVQANAQIGRPSSEWEKEYDNTDEEIVPASGVLLDDFEKGKPVFIGAIHPAEWLADAAAAR